MKKGYWCDPPLEHRGCLPEARELEVIDSHLDALEKTKQKLLSAMPEIAAVTAQGVFLKLDVLASVLRSEENTAAYNLAIGIQRDFKTMKQSASFTTP